MDMGQKKPVRILLVEDEDPLRKAWERIFRRAFPEIPCFATNNASSAYQYFHLEEANAPDPLWLVLTDNDFPLQADRDPVPNQGMLFTEFFRSFTESRACIILMSGRGGLVSPTLPGGVLAIDHILVKTQFQNEDVIKIFQDFLATKATKTS